MQVSNLIKIVSVVFELLYTERQADGMVKITAVCLKLFTAAQKIWYTCMLFSVPCLSRQCQYF
jgi:hypothetical protein